MTPTDLSSAALPLSADSLLQYEPFVRSVARGLLSSEDEVGDVVQETWVRALDKPPRSADSIKGWLARVTKNLARDRHRREGRRRARERAVASGEESVEVSSSTLEAHRAVVDGVLALEEPYKSVVVLRYYQGKSPAQIAQQLDRKPATVRSQLHRAHDLLRERLDDEFEGGRAAWAGLLVPGFSTKAATTATTGGFAATWFPMTIKLVALSLIAVALWLALPLLMQLGGNAGPGEDATLAGLSQDVAFVANADAVHSDPGIVLNDDSEVDKRSAIVSGLTVVVEHAGLPMSGVDVWILAPGDIDQARFDAQPELALDVARAFKQFGTRSSTDDFGLVDVSEFGSEFGPGFGVLAQAPGLQGLVDHSAIQDERLVVELFEVSEVRARVEDPRGRPLEGVRVALLVGNAPSARDGSTADFTTLLFSAETSADGLVSFQDFVGKFNFSTPGEPVYRLGLVVPGFDRELEFDATASSTKPLTLVLPPTCSVTVRTVDEAGEPLSIEARVTLSSADWSNPNTLTKLLSAGEAHFGHVRPGTSLKARVHSPELGIDWSAEAVCPTTPDESFTLDVVSPGRPLLSGRALNEQGEPLSETLLYVLARSLERRTLQQTQLRTDSKGAYRVELDKQIELGAEVLVSLLTHRMGRWQERADYDGTCWITPGEIKLGDARLRSGLTSISGTCVDAAGTPLPEFELSANLDSYKSSKTTRTDDEGRFQLDGLLPENVVLETRHDSDWVVVEPQSVPRGATEVVVRLALGAEIAGSVLLDEGLDTQDLWFAVYASEADSGGSWLAWAKVEADGSFLASGLASGSYTCKLGMPGQELLVLGDVEVEVSETCRDSRLQGIDLRGTFTTIEFAISSADGKRGRAHTQATLDGSIVAYATVEDGERAVLTYPSSTKPLISVHRGGYRSVAFDPENGVEDIVLAPGLVVTLTTRDRPQLREGNRTASLSLVRESGDPRVPEQLFSAHVPQSLASVGRAEVRIPGPGTYRLHASFTSNAGGAVQLASTPTALDSFVEIREADAGAELHIDLPANVFGGE